MVHLAAPRFYVFGKRRIGGQNLQLVAGAALLAARASSAMGRGQLRPRESTRRAIAQSQRKESAQGSCSWVPTSSVSIWRVRNVISVACSGAGSLHGGYEEGLAALRAILCTVAENARALYGIATWQLRTPAGTLAAVFLTARLRGRTAR